MAGRTGLEPATSGLTGQRSNHLNYRPHVNKRAGNLNLCNLPDLKSDVLKGIDNYL
jgi:hypothetical protein